MSAAGCKLKIAALTCLVAVGVARVTSAYVTYGGTCLDCHTAHSSSGDLTWTPTAISVTPGGNGSISFSLASWGIPETASAPNGYISICRIENALLNATVVAGDAGWKLNTESHVAVYVTDNLTALGTYVLDFLIGAGATPGEYSIGVLLATSGSDPGGRILRGGFLDRTGFTITVIPEPATLLLAAGVSAVFFRRPKR